MMNSSESRRYEKVFGRAVHDHDRPLTAAEVEGARADVKISPADAEILMREVGRRSGMSHFDIEIGVPSM